MGARADLRDVRELGIERGQRVRFRRGGGRPWHSGRVSGIERDGSIGVIDAKGSSRAVPIQRIEVRTTGARGAPRWESLVAVAARTEQLNLF
ncbi:MAG TPA: hypothetical protein VHM89_15655 [Acidimicrobiales bacterium]|nr:hypothetical protein [Acidimicrobiales bacterium]